MSLSQQLDGNKKTLAKDRMNNGRNGVCKTVQPKSPNGQLAAPHARMQGLGVRRPQLVAGASLLLALPWLVGEAAWAAVPGGSLDPTTISKYVTPLYVPPAMPKARGTDPGVDYYKIAARQITQQVLPQPLPKTTLWAYGSSDTPASFHVPANTIEAIANRPVRVKWSNELKGSNGRFLPHLLPVDQTMHWANPPGGPGGQDSMGTDQKPYQGPVPLVTHLHGAHVAPGSDGYPESWTLPAANGIPGSYAVRGSHWAQIAGVPDEAGAATYEYTNDQPAAHLWYHDHTLGMTRSNVYTGLTGNYMVRGGPYDLPSAQLPQGKYEVPLVIQDRAFNSDGSLFYPGDRAFFEGLKKADLQIPFIPDQATGGPSDVSPIWNPEFFSNVTVVNGNSWPTLDVEQRRYRFRLLNGSDSRFFILKIATDPTARPAVAAVPFWVVGGDGGFQAKAAQADSLLIAPAERLDVVVDFSNIPSGTPLYLVNEGPDEPYGGGTPGVDFAYADPATTGQVMQLAVVPRTSKDTSKPPQSLALLPAQDLGAPAKVRKVSVNELESGTVFANYNTDTAGNLLNIIWNPAGTGAPFGPTISMLGTQDTFGYPAPLPWMGPVTENPANNTTEVWEIYNFTADAHPVHMHLVEFQVLNRESLMTDLNGLSVAPASLLGIVRGPEAWEGGTKDTLIAYPGEVTRVKARFDRPGLYVWHCHILSHEDNDMMRPICVGTQQDCAAPLAAQ